MNEKDSVKKRKNQSLSLSSSSLPDDNQCDHDYNHHRNDDLDDNNNTNNTDNDDNNNEVNDEGIEKEQYKNQQQHSMSCHTANASVSQNDTDDSNDANNHSHVEQQEQRSSVLYSETVSSSSLLSTNELEQQQQQQQQHQDEQQQTMKTTTTTTTTTCCCPVCYQDFVLETRKRIKHEDMNMKTNTNTKQHPYCCWEEYGPLSDKCLVYHSSCSHITCLSCMNQLLLSIGPYDPLTSSSRTTNTNTNVNTSITDRNTNETSGSFKVLHIPTTTLGSCPVCRTEVSYFDLQYCYNHAFVVNNDVIPNTTTCTTNKKEDEQKEFVVDDDIVVDADTEKDMQHVVVVGTATVDDDEFILVDVDTTPSTNKKTLTTSPFPITTTTNKKNNEDPKNHNNKNNRNNNNNKNNINNKETKQKNMNWYVISSKVPAGGSVYCTNDGIGHLSIHFPKQEQEQQPTTDSQDDTSTNQHDHDDVPYIDIHKVKHYDDGTEHNSDGNDVTTRREDTSSGIITPESFYRFFSRVHNNNNNTNNNGDDSDGNLPDQLYFQNIKYHTLTSTFQGDIIMNMNPPVSSSVSSSHVNADDTDTTNIIRDDYYYRLRFILSFSDNYTCIARGLIIQETILKQQQQQEQQQSPSSVTKAKVHDSMERINHQNFHPDPTITITTTTTSRKILTLGGDYGTIYRRVNTNPLPSFTVVVEETPTTESSTTTANEITTTTTTTASRHHSQRQDEQQQQVQPNNTNNMNIPRYIPSTLWGNIFCQAVQVGVASYHFIDVTNSYISYEHITAMTGWSPLDNGRPIPCQVPFRNVQYDPINHAFHGSICWYNDYGTSWQGIQQWDYHIQFDDQYCTILDGTVYSVIINHNNNTNEKNDHDNKDVKNNNIQNSLKSSSSSSIGKEETMDTSTMSPTILDSKNHHIIKKEQSKFGDTLLYINAGIYEDFRQQIIQHNNDNKNYSLSMHSYKQRISLIEEGIKPRILTVLDHLWYIGKRNGSNPHKKSPIDYNNNL